MKKVFKLMLAVLAVSTLMFSSCKKDKDGVYTPGKKLKTTESFTITTVQGIEMKKLTQTTEFFWDGKKISKLVYKDGEGGLMGQMTFTYDKKNRFSEIYHESELNSLCKFFYEGDNLVKIVEYDDKDSEEIVSDYIFTKLDGKITKITHTVYEDDKKAEFSPLQLIVPQDLALAFERQSNTKNDISTMTITWEGCNVVKAVLDSDGSSVVNEMTYDDKINPTKGMYTSSFYYSTPELHSANNVLSETATMPIIGTLTNEYTYEYDKDNYPVKQISTHDTPILGQTKDVTEYTYE